jgi:predicted Rossmann fold flavoprotein
MTSKKSGDHFCSVGMDTMKVTETDVIIIGAGAAGLMCAIASGKRGRSVVILEHNDQIAKKVRASGGGHCNFTNIHADSENYISQNPHFAKSALARFTPQDFCAWLSEHKIAFHEKKLGQLFCDKSSQDIIGFLKSECDRYRVKIVLGVKVLDVTKKDLFCLETSAGRFRSQSLVVATGALSFPGLGASDFGYKLARQFGIKVHAYRPGLVPLIFSEKDQRLFKNLAGVSLEAVVSFDGTTFRENILFTHQGLSGPAILQISSYWQPGQAIHINLLPDTDIFTVLKDNQSKKITLKNFLINFLPSRFSQILCENILQNKPLNRYSLKELQGIAHFLGNWKIVPTGTEGYLKAEITVGGINTNELSSKTMEAKKAPGLYFIGEVVDVTGQLGGFNFQWAWSSGHAAGEYA